MVASLRLPLLAVVLLSFLASVHSATYTVLIGWQTYNDQYGPSWYSLYFYPSALTIAYGDSVTWVWNSAEVHNVVFSNGTAMSETTPSGTAFTPIAGLVGNQTHFTDYAQTYSSGLKTNHGAPVTLQFIPKTGSGNFTYYCSIHASMVGVISVLPRGSVAPLTPAQVNATVNAQLATLEGIANAQISSILSTGPLTGPGVTHATRADGTTLWTVQAGAMWMQAGFAMYARFIPAYLEIHAGDSVNFVTIGDDPHMVYFNLSNQFQLIYNNWNPDSGVPINISVSSPNPAYPLYPLPGPNNGTWPNAAGSLYSGLLFDPTVFPGLPFPQSYSVRFPTVGNWSYMCPIHYDIGMIGQLVVKAAGAALCTNPANVSTCALLTPAATVRGDPQFVGLLGQSFQVHGMDGAVYALISDEEAAVNARFAFLTGPRPCPQQKVSWTAGQAAQSISCWSHDGSYLSELGLFTAESKVHVQAGSAEEGFVRVEVDGVAVSAGKKAEGSSIVLTRHSSHHLTVSVGEWSVQVENSDGFVNLAGVSVSTPLHKLESHGLLGATHRRVKGHIEGQVDDYSIQDGDLFGTHFVYNRFEQEHD